MGQNQMQRVENDGIDRVSRLPDEILLTILSFLPTRDAVRTCILSKRWELLWTHLLNIQIDDMLYLDSVDVPSAQGFARFLDGVEQGLLPLLRFNMVKLRLSFRLFFDASRVHDLLVPAMLRKVQEVDLCLFVKEFAFKLPSLLFTSRYLTVLKIEMNRSLQLPNYILLPSLKTLHLSLVTFTDDAATQNLFFSCPYLENLAFMDCDWTEIRQITISLPTLRTLKMRDLPCFGSTNNLNECQIKIYRNNLASLKYNGSLENDIFLYYPSSIVVAHTEIPNLYKMDKEIVRRGAKLLRCLGNVKSVRMSSGAVESVFLAENFMDHLPIFRKLNHLELSEKIEAWTVSSLMGLFKRAQNLESIVFDMGIYKNVDISEDVWWLTSIPKCLFSQLKQISIHEFHGAKTEMQLVEFVVKFANVLEKIKIRCTANLLDDLDKQEEVSKWLRILLLRGPRGCTIEYL